MSIFDFFRSRTAPSTASIAKERLQIIVQHQRGKQENVDFMPKLQQELIEVISRYVKIDPSQVKVALERNDDRSVLELNVTLPDAV
ncbi:MAG: cell division topological specificity factor MinE [Gammaproteobacteria bacterium]